MGKRRHINGACIPFQIFSGTSYTRDAAHCLGFLDTLVVDLLLLTAERRGQLGLTRTNPLGHLESPRCTARRDYPTPSSSTGLRATEVIPCPPLCVCDALGPRRRRCKLCEMKATVRQRACVTSVVVTWGAGCAPLCLDRCSREAAWTPRSAGGGGLSDRGPSSCHQQMIYGAERQSQVLQAAQASDAIVSLLPCVLSEAIFGDKINSKRPDGEKKHHSQCFLTVICLKAVVELSTICEHLLLPPVLRHS